MGILKFVGISMLVSFGTFVVLFFKNATPLNSWIENAWEEIAKSLPEKYSFKLYGDCGAPDSLEKYFAPLHISSNAMMGVMHNGIVCDVYDISLSEGRGMDVPRAHGFILQMMKPYLKDKDIQRGGTLSSASKMGEYVVIDAPNKNYVYIVIVDERFRTIVYDSIEWHSSLEMKEIVLNNLDVVHEYMDKFCIVNEEAA